MSETATQSELTLWEEEVAELDAVLASLTEADWDLVTPFKGWRIFDHVHHLNLSDDLAAMAAGDPVAFAARRAATRSAASGGLGASGSPDISPAEMLALWRRGIASLGDGLATIAPGERLPWFGPDMSLRAFVAARQMESWAHGQTIHDALGRGRTPTDRLKPICELGWRTFGWSFAVRGLDVPSVPVAVRLTAPSGAVWTWGEAGADNQVSGTAEDFALVVCQCRNIADTALETRGDVAKQWMTIAQCFAGGPVDPPQPGARPALGGEAR